MARFDEMIDLYWTEAGDFMLDDNGDFKDTKLEHYRAFIQRVDSRIRSRRGEWRDESFGADLSIFTSQAMSREVASDMQNQIANQLLLDGLLRPGEFQVDVVPISERGIAIVVLVSPPGSGGQVMLTYSYDLRDNRLVPRNV